jgi:hypothetical protein
MALGHLKMLAHDGLDTLDLFAVLFDQVADVDHALVAGAGAPATRRWARRRSSTSTS